MFKPNRAEASRALGIDIDDPADAAEAGNRLCEMIPALAVLMTLGEHGAVLCRPDRDPFSLPTAARHVFDVSGAGDTVVAVMSLALGAGVSMEDGARLANFAAAAVCAEPGVYAVTRRDILREIEIFALKGNRDG